MKILVFSDLHLRGDEPWPFPEEMPEFDVALVAGDVDDAPVLAMARLMEQPSLDGKYILYVPGNHEFYGRIVNDFETADPALDAMLQITNLHCRVDVVEGVRFVGATLWTDYALYGTVEASMRQCRHDIHDHTEIWTTDGMPSEADPDVLPQFRQERRLFTPEDARRRHQAQVAFLDETLSIPFDGPSVVTTHHAPHRRSISLKYVRDKANPGYASDLTWLIEKHRPALWVHGHIHSSNDYRIGDTRIVSNPRGPTRDGGPENPDFDPWLVLDVLPDGTVNAIAREYA